MGRPLRGGWSHPPSVQASAARTFHIGAMRFLYVPQCDTNFCIPSSTRRTKKPQLFSDFSPDIRFVVNENGPNVLLFVDRVCPNTGDPHTPLQSPRSQRLASPPRASASALRSASRARRPPRPLGTPPCPGPLQGIRLGPFHSRLAPSGFRTWWTERGPDQPNIDRLATIRPSSNMPPAPSDYR